VDHDQPLTARHAGELVEAIPTPSTEADGCLLMFVTRGEEQTPYAGQTGTEKSHYAPTTRHPIDGLTTVTYPGRLWRVGEKQTPQAAGQRLTLARLSPVDPDGDAKLGRRLGRADPGRTSDTVTRGAKP
jgi:hypothetical protein